MRMAASTHRAARRSRRAPAARATSSSRTTRRPCRPAWPASTCRRARRSRCGSPDARRSLPTTCDRVHRPSCSAPATFARRTEDRPPPPRLVPGDRLALGPLAARSWRAARSSTLVALRFDGSPDEIWAGIARHGRPIQYAHIVRAARAVGRVDADCRPAGRLRAAVGRLRARLAMLHRDCAQRGIGFATITHAAGISSTGDAELDARLPFDEPYRIPPSTACGDPTPRRRRTRRRHRHDRRPRAGARRGRDGACAPATGRDQPARRATAACGSSTRFSPARTNPARATTSCCARSSTTRPWLGSTTNWDRGLPHARVRRFGAGRVAPADSAALELEHRHAGERGSASGAPPCRPASRSCRGSPARCARQHLEVGDRADADVRRVVPLVRQRLGHRHAARARPASGCGQCAKFGKLTMPMRPTRAVSRSMLLGVAQVPAACRAAARTSKLRSSNSARPVLEVELDHVDAALRRTRARWRRRSRCRSRVQPRSRAQVRQQLAVAAAQVEHARARRHQLGDHLEVGAARCALRCARRRRPRLRSPLALARAGERPARRAAELRRDAIEVGAHASPW